MKKLDNSDYMSKKDLTQEQLQFLIENMYDDLAVLVEEYSQDLPESLVYEEVLRCLTYRIYKVNPSHTEAFKVVSKGIDQGILLYKDIQQEEQEQTARVK